MVGLVVFCWCTVWNCFPFVHCGYCSVVTVLSTLLCRLWWYRCSCFVVGAGNDVFVGVVVLSVVGVVLCLQDTFLFLFVF